MRFSARRHGAYAKRRHRNFWERIFAERLNLCQRSIFKSELFADRIASDFSHDNHERSKEKPKTNTAPK